MGNKSAKQNNQAVTNFGSTMGDRSTKEYDFRTSTRDKILGEYQKLYEGAPETVGGSGAYDDPEQGLRQDVYDRYKNLADTGGWTEGDKAGYRSWTTAPISGFYTGLKDQMARQNNAIGGYAGYNSQNAKLARDAARQGYTTAQESESGLQDMIRSAKERGIQGMGSQAERLASGHHAGSAGSSTGPGTQDYYLRQMTGLMGDAEDLPYAKLQGDSYSQQAATKGPSTMDRVMQGASIVGPVVGAVIL